MTCWGTSCHFISTPRSLKFTSGYRSVISISSSYSSESTYGNYASPSFESAPSPGVSMSPMIWMCLSVKVISLGWLPPNVLLLAITVSGMGIKYQLCQIIYCLNSMSWTCIHIEYSHWDRGRFPLWFLDLGCYVVSLPHEPDSTVLVIGRDSFCSVRSRLAWLYWGWDCMRFLPSLEEVYYLRRVEDYMIIHKNLAFAGNQVHSA